MICNDKNKNIQYLNSKNHQRKKISKSSKLVTVKATAFCSLTTVPKTLKYFCITTSDGTIDENIIVKYLWVILAYLQHAVKKLCIAKRILCKLKHCAPLTVLKNICYSTVYLHLSVLCNLLGKHFCKIFAVNKIF